MNNACNYCKKPGHTEAECRKKKSDNGGGTGGKDGGVGGRNQSGSRDVTCHNCGKKGHIKKDCRSAKKDDSSPPAAAAAAAAPADSAKKKVSSAKESAITDSQVADLMSRLKSGEIKLPCSLALAKVSNPAHTCQGI